MITGNTSSLPEVLGDAGLMVDPTDTDAFAAAMLERWRDEAARAGARARVRSCGAVQLELDARRDPRRLSRAVALTSATVAPRQGGRYVPHLQMSARARRRVGGAKRRPSPRKLPADAPFGRWPEAAPRVVQARSRGWSAPTTCRPARSTSSRCGRPTRSTRRIERELGWAEGIGMNTMRVFLHDLLWQQDAEGFKKRAGAVPRHRRQARHQADVRAVRLRVGPESAAGQAARARSPASTTPAGCRAREPRRSRTRRSTRGSRPT